MPRSSPRKRKSEALVKPASATSIVLHAQPASVAVAKPAKSSRSFGRSLVRFCSAMINHQYVAFSSSALSTFFGIWFALKEQNLPFLIAVGLAISIGAKTIFGMWRERDNRVLDLEETLHQLKEEKDNEIGQ